MSNEKYFKEKYARRLTKVIGSLTFCIMRSPDHMQALELMGKALDTMAIAEVNYKDSSISNMHNTAIDIMIAVLCEKYPDMPFEDFVKVFG